MPYSKLHNFIFVHIPKCAGKSICRAFEEANIELEFKGRAPLLYKEEYCIKEMWLNHLSAHAIKCLLSSNDFETFFKFSIVRNPWDLLVSYYFYHKKEYERSPQFRLDWPGIAQRFDSSPTFDAWLHSGIYVQPQLSFLTDESGVLLVDFIGRFESLQEDFHHICSTLKLKLKLPHLNSTDHKPYRIYYNNVTRKLVETTFEKDISTFNYNF